MNKINWIHLVSPTKEEIKKISERYNFHEIIENDLLDLNTHEKIDIYDEYIFLVLHFPKYDKETQRYYLNEIDFVLGKDFILTVSDYYSSHIEKLRYEIESDEEIPIYYILYKILDVLYTKTENLLNKFSKDVYNIENAIFGKPISEKILLTLIIKKRNANLLKFIYNNQYEVIKKLGNEIKNFYKDIDDLDIYFDDIQYKLEKIINQIYINLENIENIVDYYNATMNINLNKTLKILTILTIIIGYNTFVVGIYGMNVSLPLQENSITFYLIMLFCITTSIIIYYVLKHKKWI